MLGWWKTVPARAAYHYEMAQFLEKIGYTWTPAEYRAARAGDIAFMHEYWKLREERAAG